MSKELVTTREDGTRVYRDAETPGVVTYAPPEPNQRTLTIKYSAGATVRETTLPSDTRTVSMTMVLERERLAPLAPQNVAPSVVQVFAWNKALRTEAALLLYARSADGSMEQVFGTVMQPGTAFDLSDFLQFFGPEQMLFGASDVPHSIETEAVFEL